LEVLVEDPVRTPDLSTTQRNDVSGTVYGPVIQVGSGSIGTLNVTYVESKTLVPMQLPPAPQAFVNRHSETRRVDKLIRQSHRDNRAPVILLSGAQGVGKTATFRQWAHSNRSAYLDGQIYVDLAQYRVDGSVGVSDMLAGVLRSFGLPEGQIPSSLHGRLATYRSLTAEKRLLVFVDDAEHAAHIRALIPNSSAGTVLVTSRMPLGELALDGMERVQLECLSERHSRALLGRLASLKQTELQAPAVGQLLALCAGLPLAIAVCAARLASSPIGVAGLVERLSDESSRLERIGIGMDPSLQVIFDEAYTSLPSAEARAYRLLGLHPALAFDSQSAGASIGVEHDEARLLLDYLVDHHLLTTDGVNYRFHDLLRIHARQHAQKTESPSAQFESLRRISNHYAALVQYLDVSMVTSRLRIASPKTSRWLRVSKISRAEAFEIFESERQAIVAVGVAAMEAELYEDVAAVGEALWPAYHNHKHPEEAREVFRLAAQSAAHSVSRDSEARLLAQVARAELDLGNIDEAAEALDQAGRVVAESSNELLKASIREWAGILLVAQGSIPAAIEEFLAARDACVALGNARGVLLQDYLIGKNLIRLGDSKAALPHLRRALAAVDGENDGIAHARILLHLGKALLALDELDEASAMLEAAIHQARDNATPLYEAASCEALASVSERRHDLSAATSWLSKALKIYQLMSDSREAAVADRLDGLRP
jgi:tetratricopeptide (TPR) repeat protein